ncbi:rhodanese-like domain-containing protein [Brockia lithotrophica]|uniref:Rhodanese-related sulfurtransferase n=1 Tax=Brockia lithotrophica TaxID=933949 RepID=A0A660KT21_9BACL|nr:rhodanese-like domain-containing protein [Brockia lithotrophica]RKQ83616.1 rhodanese-related sulfurtransferase [Brockia lithotrophica]
MRASPFGRAMRALSLLGLSFLIAFALGACGKAAQAPAEQSPPAGSSTAAADVNKASCNEPEILLKRTKAEFEAIRQNFNTVWVKPDVAKDRLDDYLVIDLRKPEDYAQGHLRGAQNIPFPPFAAPGEGIGAKMETLPKDKKILVYCYTGQTGAFTTALLRLNGFDAYNLAGGFNAWKAANLPLEGSAPQAGSSSGGGQAAPAPAPAPSSGGGGCGG